jgi:outer membrane protein/protease secretion system outer membrane protein
MRDTLARNLRRAVAGALLGMGLHAAPVAAIDLLRSYELALINDGQLKVARARADQGREALPQATAQLLPNVSGSAAYGHTDQVRTLNGIGDAQNYPSTSGTLQIRQPLFRLGLLSQYAEAKSKVAGTEAQLDKDTQSAGVRVTSAYFDALFSRDSLALIQAQKTSYEAQLRAARLAFRAGTGTRTDIDDIQARYDLLLADEIQARQAIEASTQQLEIYVGERVRTMSTLDSDAFRADEHDPVSLDKWVNAAMETNPDVRALKARYDAAQAAVDTATAGHFPTFDLLAQLAESKGDSTNSLPRTDNRTMYIGVQVAVPIFSGGYVTSQQRQATAAAEEARQAYDYARDDLRLQVKRQFDALKAGISRVAALEVAMRSGDQMVLSNEKGVQAGTRTVLDVLIAEQQRFNTRIELAKARYQILVAWATLQSYVGALDTEQVARMNRVLRAPPPMAM